MVQGFWFARQAGKKDKQQVKLEPRSTRDSESQRTAALPSRRHQGTEKSINKQTYKDKVENVGPPVKLQRVYRNVLQGRFSTSSGSHAVGISAGKQGNVSRACSLELDLSSTCGRALRLKDCINLGGVGNGNNLMRRG